MLLIFTFLAQLVVSLILSLVLLKLLLLSLHNHFHQVGITSLWQVSNLIIVHLFGNLSHRGMLLIALLLGTILRHLALFFSLYLGWQSL